MNMKHILLVLLMSWIAPLLAADVASARDAALQSVPQVESVQTECAIPDRLSQVSQGDCCKGHKGVCGCRAGKIVCCDNTTSATCTCHADSGVEN
jgi:hypothetical protein